jgi:hypothetical protein
MDCAGHSSHTEMRKTAACRQLPAKLAPRGACCRSIPPTPFIAIRGQGPGGFFGQGALDVGTTMTEEDSRPRRVFLASSCSSSLRGEITSAGVSSRFRSQRRGPPLWKPLGTRGDGSMPIYQPNRFHVGGEEKMTSVRPNSSTNPSSSTSATTLPLPPAATSVTGYGLHRRQAPTLKPPHGSV